MRTNPRRGCHGGWTAGLAFAVVQLFATATAPAQTWTSQDIGTVGIAGSSNDNGTTVTASRSGADVWNTSDGPIDPAATQYIGFAVTSHDNGFHLSRAGASVRCRAYTFKP